MRTTQAVGLREAAAFIALSGLLLCAPLTARGDDGAAGATAPVTAAAPRIVLPSMRAGGIAQGQVLQITEHGSEFVAVARVQLAAATPVGATTGAIAEAKPAPKLFCANGF